jgi:hypothetical protein
MEQYQKAIYIYLAGAIILLLFVDKVLNVLAGVLILAAIYEVSRIHANKARPSKAKSKRKVVKKK